MNAPTILVADDDPTFRRLIATRLGKAGFRVDAYGDGPAALRHLLFGEAADVLVTDASMPGLPDGSRLAVEARALRPCLPVVYISAPAASAADAVPDAHVLPRPYDIALVAPVVRVALATAGRTALGRDVRHAA